MLRALEARAGLRRPATMPASSRMMLAYRVLAAVAASAVFGIRRVEIRAGITQTTLVERFALPPGYTGPIRPQDSRVGARYLREFVGLCPDLRVVLALGEDPYDVCIGAGLSPTGSPKLIKTWHPLTRGRGVHERHAQQRTALADAANLLR